jgi:hypothetical protein
VCVEDGEERRVEPGDLAQEPRRPGAEGAVLLDELTRLEHERLPADRVDPAGRVRAAEFLHVRQPLLDAEHLEALAPDRLVVPLEDPELGILVR